MISGPGADSWPWRVAVPQEPLPARVPSWRRGRPLFPGGGRRASELPPGSVAWIPQEPGIAVPSLARLPPLWLGSLSTDEFAAHGLVAPPVPPVVLLRPQAPGAGCILFATCGSLSQGLPRGGRLSLPHPEAVLFPSAWPSVPCSVLPSITRETRDPSLSIPPPPDPQGAHLSPPLKLRGLPGRTAGAADGCAPNPPCARRSALQGSQSQALDLPRPPPRLTGCRRGAECGWNLPRGHPAPGSRGLGVCGCFSQVPSLP